MISDGGRRVNGGVGGGGAMAEAADGRSEARMNEWRMNGEWEAGEAASGIGGDGIIATKAREDQSGHGQHTGPICNDEEQRPTTQGSPAMCTASLA